MADKAEEVTGEQKGYLVNVDGLFISDKLDPVKPAPTPGLPPGAMFVLGNLKLIK